MFKLNIHQIVKRVFSELQALVAYQIGSRKLIRIIKFSHLKNQFGLVFGFGFFVYGSPIVNKKDEP